MKLVPFGVVLGQDDDEALVELIEARWRGGKIPGPVLGRRGDNHTHEEIENYHRLEIQWVAAPSKGDYYDGEYDSEAYAHPSLTNRKHVGTDYYISVWKDLATTEQTLSRLRAEVSRTDESRHATAPFGRKRLAYIGALQAFVAARNQAMLARMDDHAVTQQFVAHIEAQAKKGDATPPLPGLRAIRKQVALIRQRRPGAVPNAANGTAPNGS